MIFNNKSLIGYPSSLGWAPLPAREYSSVAPNSESFSPDYSTGLFNPDLSPNYVRYWPRWMLGSVFSSGSMLGAFEYSMFAGGYAAWEHQLGELKGLNTYNEWNQLRLLWYLQTSMNVTSKLDRLTYYSPYANGSIRQSYSLYDFETSLDAVGYLDVNGVLYLRNLEVVRITASPASDYTIYIGDLVPDCSVWIKWFGGYQEITPDNIINGAITVPVTGWVTVRYSSAVAASGLDSAGYVLINGDPPSKLNPIDAANCWDDHGYALSAPRFLREDNISYSNRLKAIGGYFFDDIAGNSLGGMCGRMDLAYVVTWASSSVLTLPYSDTVSVRVIGVNQTEYNVEIPYQIGHNTYVLGRVPDSVAVFTNGALTTAYSLSGAVLTFDSDLSSYPVVSYSFSSYSLSVNSSGFVTAVTANNLSPSLYYVYCSRAVTVTPLPEYPGMFNPNGTPSQYLRNLTEYEDKAQHITLGYANWNQIQWFADTVQLPQMTYIGRVLDA